jgi:hypothetical protein
MANKTIDGKQCTIVWHFDDLKISHVDPAAVTTIINLLDQTYGQQIVAGKRAAVTVNCPKQRTNYLIGGYEYAWLIADLVAACVLDNTAVQPSSTEFNQLSMSRKMDVGTRILTSTSSQGAQIESNESKAVSSRNKNLKFTATSAQPQLDIALEGSFRL